MVKVVFSDFDYTLLNYYGDNNFFDSYQVSVLKKLKDIGIKFVIVTGRSVIFFDKFSNILPYVSYIISSNGSYIYDVQNKKCIYSSYVNVDDVRILTDYVEKNNYELFYNSNGIQYKDSSDVSFDSCEQVIISFKMKYLDSVLKFVNNLNYSIYNNVSKKLGNYVIDFNNKGVSKGNGIKFLCDYLDININDTIGFGDSENDLSMFEVVGKSIAVENANKRVKKCASDVILSVKDSGVFKYIEKNILGGKK